MDSCDPARHNQASETHDCTKTLLEIPDVLCAVLAWLDPSSVVCASQTCRAWRQAVGDLQCKGRVHPSLRTVDLVASPTLLAWILPQYPSAGTKTAHLSRAAVKGGYLPTIQYLNDHGLFYGYWASRFAAEHGYVEILQWIEECNCNSFVDVIHPDVIFNAAIENGHVRVLQWIRDYVHKPKNSYYRTAGSASDGQTHCWSAAERGQLEVLKWLRTNGSADGVNYTGSAWDERTCLEAAKNGHLAVLQWARENGCPWDPTECAKVAKTSEIRTWITGQQN